ncbi:translation initiation factor IF-3 [Ilyonectria sp. MPI-CAGE-AT-0026]|nr:translation initiation factor IF-3 [Ilyonectria sp. MPI-CAGE-AT-0026]
MSSLSCFNNSRRALYRVFVSPLERREASLQRQLLPLVHGHASTAARPPTIHGLHQSRSFVASASRLKSLRPALEPRVVDDDDRGFDKRYTTKEDVTKSGRDRYPQDHEITDPKIMVLDNGNFDGPLLTRHVLTRLDDSESLRMVNPYVPAKPKDGIPAQYAVCKVVNKKEEYERQREAKERRRVSKATSAKSKELELNWAIGDHDMQTKMRQLSNFLSKGMRVEVILGKKKNSRKVDDAEAGEVLDKVKKGVEEVGAREYKPMNGHVNKTLRLYLEGVSK